MDAKQGCVVLLAVRLEDTTAKEIDAAVRDMVQKTYKTMPGSGAIPSPRVFKASNGTPCVELRLTDLVDAWDGRMGAYFVQAWDYVAVRECLAADDAVTDIGVDALDILAAAWDMPIKTFQEFSENPDAMPGYAYIGDVLYTPKPEPEPPWPGQDYNYDDEEEDE